MTLTRASRGDSSREVKQAMVLHAAVGESGASDKPAEERVQEKYVF